MKRTMSTISTILDTIRSSTRLHFFILAIGVVIIGIYYAAYSVLNDSAHINRIFHVDTTTKALSIEFNMDEEGELDVYPGDTTGMETILDNHGVKDAYVFVKIDKPPELVIKDIAIEWELLPGEENVYYLDHALEVGGNTTVFSEIKIDDNCVGGDLELDVEAYAYATEAFDSNVSMAYVWQHRGD